MNLKKRTPNTLTQIQTYTHTNTHTHTYIGNYICTCI